MLQGQAAVTLFAFRTRIHRRSRSSRSLWDRDDSPFLLGAAPAAQPSPAQPSPPLADAKHKHLLASSGEGQGKRQEPQDYGKILSGRWLTNAAGMAGRGAGVEGMGCATAGPAFIGLCRTQETTSGAVPAQQYAECSEEHTVKASASTPYSLPNARAGSLL